MNRKEKAALKDLAEKLIELSNGKIPQEPRFTSMLKRVLSATTSTKAEGGTKKANTRKSAIKVAPVAAPSKRLHTHGLADLPDGTEMFTVVRTKKNGVTHRHRVKAEVKNGKIYIDGKARGIGKLSKAIDSARSMVPGRVVSTVGGTRAWKISSTGETVEEYRRTRNNGKASKSTQLNLAL